MSMFMQTHSFPFKKLFAWKLSLWGAFVCAHMDKITFLFMSFHCDSCRHRAGEPNDLFSTHRTTPHPPHPKGWTEHVTHYCRSVVRAAPAPHLKEKTLLISNVFFFFNECNIGTWKKDFNWQFSKSSQCIFFYFSCFYSLLQSVILSSGLVG